MGGMVPLGYDSVNKKLVISSEEAVTVRRLFELYCEEKSIRAVQDRAQVLGLKTKHRVAARNGRSSGRSDFSCGHLRPFFPIRFMLAGSAIAVRSTMASTKRS